MNSREFWTMLDHACVDGADYVLSCTDYRTAWDGCARGDWMLWAAGWADVDRRKLAGALAACVNTVSHLMLCQSSIDALQGLRRYADGEIGEEQLELLGEAAWDDPRASGSADVAVGHAAALRTADALLAASQACDDLSISDNMRRYADLTRAHIRYEDLNINF